MPTLRLSWCWGCEVWSLCLGGKYFTHRVLALIFMLWHPSTVEVLKSCSASSSRWLKSYRDNNLRCSIHVFSLKLDLCNLNFAQELHDSKCWIHGNFHHMTDASAFPRWVFLPWEPTSLLCHMVRKTFWPPLTLQGWCSSLPCVGLIWIILAHRVPLPA